MSRSYRIDIEMTVGQAGKDFDERQIRDAVFPYLFEPSLDPNNGEDLEYITNSLTDEFDSFNHRKGKHNGAPCVTVSASHTTSFCNGYSEDEFETEVAKQIERFKKELSYPFEVIVRLHYLEHEPVVCVRESNFRE